MDEGPAAALLQQIFEVDPLACPTCHGPMRVVAFITQASVIDRHLAHLRTRAEARHHAPHTRPPTPRLPLRTRPPTPRDHAGPFGVRGSPPAAARWRLGERAGLVAPAAVGCVAGPPTRGAWLLRRAHRLVGPLHALPHRALSEPSILAAWSVLSLVACGTRLRAPAGWVRLRCEQAPRFVCGRAYGGAPRRK